MPRGFVNRRDRFRWDNVHFPDGENPLSSDSVTYDGQTLTQALDRLEEGVCFVEATPGASVTFMTADAAPLKSLKVAIVFNQSGSGDPSPDNVRPISGSTKCTVQVGDGVNTPTDYEIAFGADVGTVYGGTLDVLTGVLTVTDILSTIDETADVSVVASGGVWAVGAFFEIDLGAGSTICDQYTRAEDRVNAQAIKQYNPDFSYCSRTSPSALTKYVYFKDSRWNEGDEESILAWLADHPVHIVQKLATPQTYQLTPTEIETLIGTNVVTANTGDITELIFKDTFSNEVNLIWQVINDLDARVSALEGNKSITPPPDDQKKTVTEEEPAEEIVDEQPVKKTTRKKSTNTEKEE